MANLPEISMATSVRCGTYKAECFDNALFMVETIVDKWDRINKYIDLPKKNLHMHLRPIRNNYGKAYTFIALEDEVEVIRHRHFMVEIDVRQDEDTFQDTLLHELIHVEQFYQKRLRSGDTKTQFKWGRNMVDVGKLCYEEYVALPWEQEAATRALKLKKKVFGM